MYNLNPVGMDENFYLVITQQDWGGHQIISPYHFVIYDENYLLHPYWKETPVIAPVTHSVTITSQRGHQKHPISQIITIYQYQNVYKVGFNVMKFYIFKSPDILKPESLPNYTLI